MACEYVFFSQAVQLAFPWGDLNLPCTQAEHSVPSDPVYPAWHLHDSMPILPKGQLELPGHCKQTLLVVFRHDSDSYSPTLHCKHGLHTLLLFGEQGTSSHSSSVQFVHLTRQSSNCALWKEEHCLKR